MTKYVVTVNDKEESLKAICDERGANYYTARLRYMRGIRNIDTLLSEKRVQIYKPTPRKKKVKEVIKVHTCMNGVEEVIVDERSEVQLPDLLDKETVRILGAIKVQYSLNTYEEAVDFLTGVWLALQKQEPVKAKKKLFGLW